MATRRVHCARLKADLPGLDKPPFPGSLGKEILDRVSQEAWDAWTAEEIIVINHYGLNLISPADQDFLLQKMRAYLLEGAPPTDTSQPPTDRPAS